MQRKLLFIIALCLFSFSLFAQPEAALGKIKKEGLDNSRVMDIAMHLTDMSGPRLTNSPGWRRAATWARDELSRMGMVNTTLEPWGDFGTGWEVNHFYLAMTAPYYSQIVAIPRAWTGGTPGRRMYSGDVVLVKAKDSAELYQNYAGKLKGKIIMVYSTDTLRPNYKADALRLADTTLEKMSIAKLDTSRPGPPNFSNIPNNRRQMMQLQRQMGDFFKNEHPAVVLSMSARGNEGTLFVQNGGSYVKDAVNDYAWVMLSSDDYLRIQRLVNAGVPVQMDADIKTTFYNDDLKGYDVVGEIPGTDPVLKDELVIIGGHLDSWHGATGATDNGAGSAVMMEVMRILKSIGLPLRRTIRICLWSGEEEGLLGSRGYVKNHFADPADMILKPEQSKVSAYYNLDNGSGKIRGIYLQGNKNAGPIFEKWLEPFHDMGARTVTISNTGGTDHQSFDAVGIPGFQFIQDPLEYETRTHHTNMDTYDHLSPEDLKQAATIIAYFVYNTAQRTERIPRKELPKPRGANGGRMF